MDFFGRLQLHIMAPRFSQLLPPLSLCAAVQRAWLEKGALHSCQPRHTPPRPPALANLLKDSAHKNPASFFMFAGTLYVTFIPKSDPCEADNKDIFMDLDFFFPPFLGELG